MLFGEIRQPVHDYVLVPRHSSENRAYIPIGFIQSDVICGDSNLLIPNAKVFQFGVVQSLMHMAWVRSVCGRIKSDYRYSASIVYNNFPWPDLPPPQPSPAARGGSYSSGGGTKARDAIEAAAQAVLDTRAQFPDATLADLYDPLSMPPVLVKAHQTLDRAVDAAYGKRTFKSDAERVAFLFERYQQLTSLLPVASKKKIRKRKATGDGTGD